MHQRILTTDPELAVAEPWPKARPALTVPQGRPIPRQLPAGVAQFVGRERELEALDGLLAQATAPPAGGTVVISAIGGTAGIGKTALAVHWAHQVAGRFGDGQLYVDLRGFDPSGTPATAAGAIRGFLDALGVPPERIPASPEAQVGLYRSLLSGKRMLILLDNARDEQQVRPLLPASPASLIIVTSRNQLSGLAAADGARLLILDILTHGEAVQLLTARLGSDQAAEEPGAVGEIADLCECLPLALAVAAARAARRLPAGHGVVRRRAPGFAGPGQPRRGQRVRHPRLAIPWAMEIYLDRQGHWDDLAATQLTALAAAERLGNKAG
jgi:NB-ARC domain